MRGLASGGRTDVDDAAGGGPAPQQRQKLLCDRHHPCGTTGLALLKVSSSPRVSVPDHVAAEALKRPSPLKQ